MQQYKADQLLRLAKRHHNTKRTYLLVDPLQGKHIPVSPTESLTMLRTLGRQFAAQAPDVDLVIGFAETATAVGAVIASMLSPDCRYIHTTREPSAISGKVIEFQEEHSHVTEQFLCMEQLEKWVKQAHTIAFVDDELSTGKTLLNMITEIRAHLPEINRKQIWAVSIINRLTEERVAVLEAQGVRCFSLLQLPMADLSGQVACYAITAPQAPQPCKCSLNQVVLPPITADTRHGCRIGDFLMQCRYLAETVYPEIAKAIRGKRVSVIGTEEWMLPGLLLGEAIETCGEAASVHFHATTRSPIGVCSDDEYPIKSGTVLHSFYHAERATFLYNLQPCDIVIILTDSPDDAAALLAYDDLCGAYASLGCDNVVLIKEDGHVRNIP